jgi:hypothetical protein
MAMAQMVVLAAAVLNGGEHQELLEELVIPHQRLQAKEAVEGLLQRLAGSRVLAAAALLLLEGQQQVLRQAMEVMEPLRLFLELQ